MGDLYQALADHTRRLILDELTERDGQTLSLFQADLAAQGGCGRPGDRWVRGSR
ncbi:hypothetical protein AB0F83_06240 [Micromonospora chalcea]